MGLPILPFRVDLFRVEINQFKLHTDNTFWNGSHLLNLFVDHINDSFTVVAPEETVIIKTLYIFVSLGFAIMKNWREGAGSLPRLKDLHNVADINLSNVSTRHKVHLKICRM